MLDNKLKNHLNPFHSIYIERGFLKMEQQLSVGLARPWRWSNFSWSLLFLMFAVNVYLRKLIFADRWKNRKN